MAAHPDFAALREALDVRYRGASPAAFVAAGTEAGSFPKGAIATLEGPASSGRTALAAQALAAATAAGEATALVVWEGDPNGAPSAVSLSSAGVLLERLLLVRVSAPLEVVRAADILLRAQAFGTIVIPAVPASRRVNAAAWTRLVQLAHRAHASLIVVGEASEELRAMAALRVECALVDVRWIGSGGLFGELAGYAVHAEIRKHKHALNHALDHALNDRLRRDLAAAAGV